MAHDVHLHVCFPCNDHGAVAEVAKRHLPSIHARADAEDPGVREARAFLRALSQRSGLAEGWKGGLSTWGVVGNYTDEDAFVDVLGPFWLELFSEFDGGPLSFERAIVFFEHEQTEAAGCWELWRDENRDEMRNEDKPVREGTLALFGEKLMGLDLGSIRHAKGEVCAKCAEAFLREAERKARDEQSPS